MSVPTRVSKPLVLVTGGSGFIAGHVCQLLASVGFQVRTTVRSKSPSKTAHLQDMGVEVIDGIDLLEPNCWDAVLDGCEIVHHCASPFFFTTPGGDPMNGFVKPALQGTRNVLLAAIKANVKRVVLTSSCAAITWGHVNNHPQQESHIWTEDDWQKDNTLENGAYRFSKRVAEQEAWKLVHNTAVELVTICPSFVLGPILSPRADAASIMFMRSMCDGTTEKMAASAFGCVDVRNVADAHVSAMSVDLHQPGLKNNREEARFILSSECSYPHLQIANTLRDAENGMYGQKYAIPTESEGLPLQEVHYSNARARHFLGVNFHPLKTSLVDGVLSLEQHGLLKVKEDDYSNL